MNARRGQCSEARRRELQPVELPEAAEEALPAKQAGRFAGCGRNSFFKRTGSRKKTEEMLWSRRKNSGDINIRY